MTHNLHSSCMYLSSSVYTCSAYISTCTLHQFYVAFRTAAGKEESVEGSTAVTDLSVGSLQRCTLAAMQGEIDALREELKKQGKVGAWL